MSVSADPPLLSCVDGDEECSLRGLPLSTIMGLVGGGAEKALLEFIKDLLAEAISAHARQSPGEKRFEVRGFNLILCDDIGYEQIIL